MATQLPSAEVIRDRLLGMNHADVKALAGKSRVPFTTLWKIRAGETTNPGIETVRKFIGFLPKPKQAA